MTKSVLSNQSRTSASGNSEGGDLLGGSPHTNREATNECKIQDNENLARLTTAFRQWIFFSINKNQKEQMKDIMILLA